MARRRITTTVTDLDDAPRRRKRGSDPLRTIAAIILLFLFAVAMSQYGHCQDLNAAVHDAAVSLQNPQNGITQYAMPEFTVQLSDAPELNATANTRTHIITLNTILVRVLYRDPGELAFAIAHEVGHLQDANCATRAAKAGMKGAALSRFCEASADRIGMQYLIAAGYSPFDAAGLMGKLLMVDPGNSVLGIVIGRFTADHPVSVDRIKQLAEYAREACADRPEMCHQ